MALQLIERSRLLPYHGHVSIAEGAWVEETQTVAHLDYVPAAMQRVRVSSDLVIEPSELKDAMLKHDGDYVEAGEALATSFLFGERRVAIAPFGGYIGLISRRLGNAYLRQPIPLGQSERAEIDVPKELGIAAGDLHRVLKVKVGMRVMSGQLIAESSGLNRKILVSPLYGQVKSIGNGKVVIEAVQVKTELQAYLQGRVIRVLPRQGVVIRALAEVISGQYGVGGEQGGELLIAAEASERLTAGQVTTKWRGKVVVAGRSADLDLLQAAADVGSSALIVGHLPFTTLKDYLGEAGTPGLTGNEDTGMTIILTERFSASVMQAKTWNELHSLQGRYASVNGTTHIRAGVIRPEIVVCEPESSEQPQQIVPDHELRVGDQVRIVRQPWRDQRGVIVELPPKRQLLETGSEAQVALIELDSGMIAVPISNLVSVGKECR